MVLFVLRINDQLVLKILYIYNDFTLVYPKMILTFICNI
jgi:hypothetical protein